MIKARFKDGVAIPERSIDVLDGTVVGIIIPERQASAVVEVPPELKEEFDFWDQLSSASWEKFLEWERETAE